MSRKRKRIPRSLNQIRKFTYSDLSHYTKKQLRSIEKKIVKSQNMKIDRIERAGFGLVGRIKDYVNKKGKISTSTIRTKKDNLIGRIMSLNELTTDKHSSVRTLKKAYSTYNKGTKRYGELTKEQYSKIANLWYNYRNNRTAYKFSSDEVYTSAQEYISEGQTEDISTILTKLTEKKQKEKAILDMIEPTIRKSLIPDPYYSPKDL